MFGYKSILYWLIALIYMVDILESFFSFETSLHHFDSFDHLNSPHLRPHHTTMASPSPCAVYMLALKERSNTISHLRLYTKGHAYAPIGKKKEKFEISWKGVNIARPLRFWRLLSLDMHIGKEICDIYITEVKNASTVT